MLTNAAHIGRWTFGKKQWRKDPITRKRRYVKRSEGVQVQERPKLRIVPDDLWESVQARRREVRENYSGAGVGAPGHRTKRPFSGLVFCGVCGHRMVDGGGSTCRGYRCSAASTGGACSNEGRLREDVLVEAAVTELKRVLFETDLVEKLAGKIRARLATFKLSTEDESMRLNKNLSGLDAEEANLVSFLRATDPAKSPGSFETVRSSLDALARERQEVRAKLASLRQPKELRPPTPDEIAAFVMDVEARLTEDPTTAREALRRVLLNGQITVYPEPDGTWRAESMLITERLAGTRTRKPRNGGPSGASGTSTASGEEVVEIDGCAGRI